MKFDVSDLFCEKDKVRGWMHVFYAGQPKPMGFSLWLARLLRKVLRRYAKKDTSV